MKFTMIFRILNQTLWIFAVLAELDDLKKTSDGVRNTIRWLEREFMNGSRFIRLQRNNETKQLTLIKVPKKLGKTSHC